ncbi:uncharacterized protein LOC116460200 isoform X2 [Hylobates moloch]|uniref:uncharacterized protein LOC116460200 isoform X2 n=1 Tax=Hylobates moloch TaxID=81572 RepID=UPI0026768584|nr:uncharacterized protein LOC116460200 isoform X2 [Hylobates moloch]
MRPLPAWCLASCGGTAVCACPSHQGLAINRSCSFQAGHVSTTSSFSWGIKIPGANPLLPPKGATGSHSLQSAEHGSTRILHVHSEETHGGQMQGRVLQEWQRLTPENAVKLQIYTVHWKLTKIALQLLRTWSPCKTVTIYDSFQHAVTQLSAWPTVSSQVPPHAHTLSCCLVKKMPASPSAMIVTLLRPPQLCRTTMEMTLDKKQI